MEGIYNYASCLPDFLENVEPVGLQGKIRQRMITKKRRIRENFERSQVEQRLRGINE